jgi:hypothetical protein
MLWRIARAAAPVAQPVAPVIDPSTTPRKCTPAFHDASSIADIPGIVKVVRIDNFLGIVAETE